MIRSELKELIKEEYHKTLLNESKKNAILGAIEDLEKHLRSINLKDSRTYISWLNKMWIGVEKAKI